MIIGIGYKRGSGKDTVAEHLVETHNFRRRAFADSLKAAARAIFGWDDRHLHGDLKESVDPYWGMSPRWALQRMGTEAMRRNVADDVWIRSLRRHMIDSPQSDWVIPDVRFINEIKAIREWGGVLWRVDRSRIMLGYDGHASEIELDDYRDWDAVIVNDGTLDELFEKVDACL